MADFFDIKNERILLRVRLTPNARKEALGKMVVDENNVYWLKISVRAVPENGKANKALIAFVAKKLGISKNKIELASGDQARTKKLSIEDATDSLIKSIKNLAGN